MADSPVVPSSLAAPATPSAPRSPQWWNQKDEGLCKLDDCHEPRSEGSGYCSAHRAPILDAKRKIQLEEEAKSSPTSQMVCPHCQVKGKVHTSVVRAKKGISGGKATGALLTGGLSMLVTGLSRKETITQARCGNCGATWTY